MSDGRSEVWRIVVVTTDGEVVEGTQLFVREEDARASLEGTLASSPSWKGGNIQRGVIAWEAA